MSSGEANGSSAAPDGKVAVLLRVSTDEQRERETIGLQRAFLAEFCKLYGLEVHEIYADDGVSGTVPLHERPEGRRLLEDARAGESRRSCSTGSTGWAGRCWS